MQPTDQTEEITTLGKWFRSEWCLVLITVGIGIDWLPSVLAASDSAEMAKWSGTKLLVLPGLLCAFIRRPSWVVRPHPLGVAYLLAVGIGGGLGWLAGNVQIWRLVAIVVNGLILLYFLRMRSLCSIKRVLAISFGLSILVPVVQWLTKMGIFYPDVPKSIEEGPDFERIFSLFDTTTIGFAPLLIAASIGGLVFVQGRLMGKLPSVVVCMSVVSFGVSGTILAAQRSGIAAYGASLLAALVLYAMWERRRMAWLLMVGIVLIGTVSISWESLGDVGGSLETRFMDRTGFDEALELRYDGVRTFLSDLMGSLDLTAKGPDSLFRRTGVFPHLLLSEAYYEGGPLFFGVIGVILVRFGIACVFVARSSGRDAKIVGLCLCAFGAGAAIQVSIQTALVLRLLPLILGVGIAAGDIMAIRARFERLRGR